MLRAVELAHLILRQAVRPGALAVDATVGNGHDTLFLAGLVGPKGQVFGFDVQEAALRKAAERLQGRHQVTLFHSGHETLASRLPSGANGVVAAVMFNLGYLPGAPKTVSTRSESTLAALRQALDVIAAGGYITVVTYPGHEGGAEETAAVKLYAKTLPAAFAAANYSRLNAAQPAPELIAIMRRHR